MVYAIVRHKVADFEKWKKVFEEHGEMRGKGGCKTCTLYQTAEDPNEVLIVLEWDTAENLRAFAESQDLKEAMERSGVVDESSIYTVEKVGDYTP